MVKPLCKCKDLSSSSKDPSEIQGWQWALRITTYLQGHGGRARTILADSPYAVLNNRKTLSQTRWKVKTFAQDCPLSSLCAVACPCPKSHMQTCTHTIHTIIQTYRMIFFFFLGGMELERWLGS